MQGRSQGQRELLDAESLAGHLLRPGSVFAFLAEHRQRLFPEALFADLFPSRTGRPSVPADVMASVIVLQALHGYSDSETTDAVTFDLRWKAAVGWPVMDKAFHDTTLTYWRRRLAASDRPNRVFEAVQQVVAETGVLKGKARRALDSTVLDDAVATQDTVTQLIAAIRRVRREVPGADAVVAAVTRAHDYDDAGKPRIAWNDADARAALVDGLVRDALAVLDALGADPSQATAADAVGLLALVAGQDVELVDPDDGSGEQPRWRIARRVAADRVISTVDPQARHAHKTVSRRQDGYKAHVAVEPDTGIVTAAELTQASEEHGADGAAGIRLLAADPTLGPEPVAVLGDSAYGTGAVLDALQQAGHEPLVKPWPIRPVVPGGFTLDDFAVDEQARTVTCPAGATRPMSPKRTATFGTACRGCPLRARCTTAAKGRTLKVHPHDALQREHRRRADDPAWQNAYRQHRPMVERSIAWLTAGGNRRLLNLGLRLEDGAWQTG